MKNGHNKRCDCGKTPCLSHKYHGRYMCMKCAESKGLEGIEAKCLKSQLITDLLHLEGHQNLSCFYSRDVLCIADRSEKAYYSISQTDMFDGRDLNTLHDDGSECIYYTKVGCNLYCVHKHTSPVYCDVYLFLAYGLAAFTVPLTSS